MKSSTIGAVNAGSDNPMQSLHGIDWDLNTEIATIVLNRPEQHNALGLTNAIALAQAINEVIAIQPRSLIIKSRGSIFCAGGDISEFKLAGENLEVLVSDILDVLLPAYLKLAQATFPVISLISGSVGGAGIGLALCADFVLASDTMKLRTGYSAIGLSPDVGASYFLSKRIGTIRAKQWLMLSQAVDVQRCLAAGAVDQVYPVGELEAAGDALALQLAHMAPHSLAAIKYLSNETPHLSLQAYLSLEQQLLRNCAQTSDATEGITAFLQKRHPQFTGR